MSASGFWNQIFQNVFVELLTIVAVPLILGLWAKRTHEWSWPVLIVFVLVAIAASTFLYDRFWPNPDAWRVHAWLVADKYSIREESREGFNFAYKVTSDAGFTFGIAQKSRSHEVLIEAPLSFGSMLDGLSAAQQNEIIRNLNLEMLRLEIGFGDFAPGGHPYLQDVLWLTGSTDEAEFFRRMFRMRSASKLFLVVASRRPI